jgi:hypothetical protein
MILTRVKEDLMEYYLITIIGIVAQSVDRAGGQVGISSGALE